jgi:hypothetical protein
MSVLSKSGHDANTLPLPGSVEGGRCQQIWQHRDFSETYLLSQNEHQIERSPSFHGQKLPSSGVQCFLTVNEQLVNHFEQSQRAHILAHLKGHFVRHLEWESCPKKLQNCCLSMKNSGMVTPEIISSENSKTGRRNAKCKVSRTLLLTYTSSYFRTRRRITDT